MLNTVKQHIIMKLTLFTLAIFTLFVGTCTAGSYQNGFITGMMIEKISPSKKAKPIKYNTVIIDTSLFDFPTQKSPVCRPILVRERKYKELTFGDKCLFAVIAILIWMVLIHTCCHGSQEERDFMIGCIIGGMVERLFSDDE